MCLWEGDTGSLDRLLCRYKDVCVGGECFLMELCPLEFVHLLAEQEALFHKARQKFLASAASIQSDRSSPVWLSTRWWGPHVFNDKQIYNYVIWCDRRGGLENGTRFSQVFAQLGIRDLRGDGCGPEIRKRGRQCGPSISGIFRLLVGQSLQIGVLEFLAQTVLVRRWMVLSFLHPGQ